MKRTKHNFWKSESYVDFLARRKQKEINYDYYLDVLSREKKKDDGVVYVNYRVDWLYFFMIAMGLINLSLPFLLVWTNFMFINIFLGLIIIFIALSNIKKCLSRVYE